jgi:hypothetical protein
MVSIYNTLVDAKSWGSDIPASIHTARNYYQHVDPRRFYVIVGPINQLLVLLTTILFWKQSPRLRVYFSASFVLYAAIVILTLTYFVPRDLILFTSAIGHVGETQVASSRVRSIPRPFARPAITQPTTINCLNVEIIT